MGRESNAVKTLKAFYKDTNVSLNTDAFSAELKGTSDRVAVTIVCALLDDALELAIMKKLQPLKNAEYDRLFEFDGIIGSFSARIDMAHALGAIDRTLKDRLHDLREMRNACAHSKRPISFNDIELLNVWKRAMRGSIFINPKPTAVGYRGALISEFFYVFNVLATSEAEAKVMLKDAFDRALELQKKKQQTA